MKVDFKTLESHRARAGEFRFVDVPPLQYLMSDGHGDPNTAREYADAIAALYPIAYKLKFASKECLGGLRRDAPGGSVVGVRHAGVHHRAGQVAGTKRSTSATLARWSRPNCAPYFDSPS